MVTAPPSPVVTILRGWKLEAAGSTEPAAGTTAVACPQGAGGVLDQRQVGQLLEARGAPEQVHRHDRLRPRRDLDLRGVDVVRRRVDVGEDGRGAGERNDVRGRGKRVGGDDHLVAGPDPKGEDGEVEGGGARRDRDGVLDLARGGEARLELGDLVAHRQHPALQHLGDRGRLAGAGVGPG